MQIWDGNRHSLKGRPQRQWHAEHRAVEVEGRQLLASRNGQINPRKAAKQPHQRLWHLQDNMQPAGCRQRCVSAELQGISEPLLGMDQQRQIVRLLAPPLRRVKVAPDMSSL